MGFPLGPTGLLGKPSSKSVRFGISWCAPICGTQRAKAARPQTVYPSALKEKRLIRSEFQRIPEGK